MPALLPIRSTVAGSRTAVWSLLELAIPGVSPQPLGVIVADPQSGGFQILCREAAELDLEEDEADVVDALPQDLADKARELGVTQLLDSLEDSLSNFLRITDRDEIALESSLPALADELYERYVDSGVYPFTKHLPVYSLRAAATKFGEQMEAEELRWQRMPKSLRLTPDMFIAQVVGRSMEPLIPDGSFCVFRAATTGSRQGKRLLIEQFSELDTASRFTVKRYTSTKSVDPETGEWAHERIRLEPLNREFEAFELEPGACRVIAEFVQVIDN